VTRMTPAPRCPHRHYRTERYARRQAFSIEPDRNRRPTPQPCECGIGAWRLAETTTAPTNDQPRS